MIVRHGGTTDTDQRALTRPPLSRPARRAGAAYAVLGGLWATSVTLDHLPDIRGTEAVALLVSLLAPALVVGNEALVRRVELEVYRGTWVEEGRGARLVAVLARAPGPIHLAAIAVAAAWLVVAAATPFDDLHALLVPHALLVVLGATWACRWRWAVSARLAALPIERGRAWGLRFALSAAVITVAIVVSSTSIPWDVRWSRIRPDFEQAVAEHRTEPGMIGGLPVRSIRRSGDRVSFEWGGVQGPCVMACGRTELIVFAPHGLPDDLRNDREVRALGHGWYLVALPPPGRS